MALRDEVITLLREILGPGYETATLAVLMKEYTLRSLAPQLKARRVAALDFSTYESARKTAETTLQTEVTARATTIAATEASVDSEMSTV